MSGMADDRRTGIRVNLTLPKDVIAVLDRISKVTGSGRASFIRELLQDGVPQFQQMAQALELAKDKNVDAYRVMAETVRELSGTVDQLSLNIKTDRRRAMRKRKK
jgi:metal-responsive CopG/Arc/MetJ family transcriptional regulator